MDEKISIKAIDQFAIQVANQLAEGFFSKKTTITGPEIVQLCEVKQVNFFIIHDLLRVWKKEIEKLKSPYFDYSAKAVTDVLNQFQVTLSNHIAIGKADFLPLLKHSVSQSLFLILNPYDFYSELLDSKEEPLLLKDLEDRVKYIKINKAPLEALVARLKQSGTEVVKGKEAFALLDQILEEVNFTPEEIEPHLAAFGKIVPVDVGRFYEQKQVTQPVTETKPTVEVKPIEQKPAASHAQSPYVPETKTTLADNLAKQKITKLKETLTINQKFMFTKILFHGDFEIFTDAIDKLDRFDNLTQAMRFIDDAYPDWDRESEEYEEFLEILQNRFS
ncbi:MAG: hypothetical protein BroJett042_22080 [Bacteroidota bacterium]|nr:MAG: hypothetical protein BroJett042_22080 [Bacteroidota bacterium]